MSLRLALGLLTVLFFSNVANAQESSPQESSAQAQESAAPANEDSKALWEAARIGDAPSVKKLLEKGVEADTANNYGGTALMFSCARGHSRVVQLLLEAGADPNARDRFYSATPMGWAAMKGNVGVAVALVKAGSKETAAALSLAVRSNDAAVTEQLLELHEYSESERKSVASRLPKDASDELKELFKEELAAASKMAEEKSEGAEAEPSAEPEPKAEGVAWEPDAEKLKTYAGVFGLDDGTRVQTKLRGPSLVLVMDGNETQLAPKSENEFQFLESMVKFNFKDEKLANLIIVANKISRKYDILSEEELSEFKQSSESSLMADRAISSSDWMQFRGNQARGIAEGQNPPTEWNGQEEENLLWKQPIAGLGHSCPIVVDDKVFITTAVGESDSEGIRTGLYGDVDSVEDQSIHQFKLLCLDKTTGNLIWERTAYTGKPAVKRHLKSTHANSTPASDGEHVVAFFGSEGLYCFDTKGNLLWEKDLGYLDSGWFFDASFQWGFAASPIIFEDQVIVQCDIQEDSFIASFNIESGAEQWRTPRDEIPSWSTPSVCQTSQGPQLVTNSTHFSRAYNPYTGEELWRINKNSEIAVPTPFAAHDLIYVTSGYRPIQPIYAIHPSSRGDISLPKGETVTDQVAWSMSRGGPYMPTPICYGDYLYTISNSGILVCYEATSGKRVYRVRLGTGEAKSFVGSPVAADGHLYFPAESGDVLVVKAGPDFEKIAINPMGESMLSSPAISDGVILLRGEKHLFAFGEKKTLE